MWYSSNSSFYDDEAVNNPKSTRRGSCQIVIWEASCHHWGPGRLQGGNGEQLKLPGASVSYQWCWYLGILLWSDYWMLSCEQLMGLEGIHPRADVANGHWQLPRRSFQACLKSQKSFWPVPILLALFILLGFVLFCLDFTYFCNQEASLITCLNLFLAPQESFRQEQIATGWLLDSLLDSLLFNSPELLSDACAQWWTPKTRRFALNIPKQIGACVEEQFVRQL